MKSKIIFSLFVATILVTLGMIGTTQAAPMADLQSASQLTASEDAYVTYNEPAVPHENMGLSLEYQAPPSQGTISVALVKFTGVSMANPITQVRLNLFATGCGVFFPFDPARVDIYAVNDDSWSAGTVTWNTRPTRDQFLMSIDGGLPIIEHYNYWTDTSNGAFAQFVQSQNSSASGDGTVSLWLEFGNASGNNVATFMDTDGAGGYCGSASNYHPILQFADTQGPLAITLSSFSAHYTANGWLTGIGAGLLLIVLIGMILYFRRTPK